jgi:hypothetical protein
MAKRAMRTVQQRRLDPKRNIVPDQLDLRDRPYLPTLLAPPDVEMLPKLKLPLLDQGRTNACTGFALASVVNFLVRRHRDARAPEMSPYMLYSMARRYDEFPDPPKARIETTPRSEGDTGSSLRGAMKAWYKHGVCRLDLWRGPEMPPPTLKPEDDWWLDAARRPLGAYYRVDTRSVTDMHVALHDVGILYASVVCHSGWLRGNRVEGGKKIWTIPRAEAQPDDGGHAFVIVGYTQSGFIIQNSWGTTWGTRGLALLTYEDWTDNAMDCWVAQLGVATEQHLEIARSTSLRVERGKVKIASDHTLRDREISPFIIDMENNGRLSESGIFRTKREDVEALVSFHIGEARKKWGLKVAEPTDVAIYAHGGLTGEGVAAETAARWIPALYEAKIFPIFLMWETDLWSTLKNRLQDLVTGQPRPTAGAVDQLKRFWNQRLERLLAPAGSTIWGEMKQNADAITVSAKSGGLVLYESGMQSPWFTKTPVHLHMIGHSAGAIVHCYAVDRLAQLGWRFESVNFMAGAATLDLFKKTLLPRIADKTVKQFRAFHLSDSAEQQDPTCRPVLGYSRSLLYLVSESFEGGVRTPLVGMEKYFKEEVLSLGLPNVKVWVAPSPATSSTTHGGFDDDPATMSSIIALIRGQEIGRPMARGRRMRGAQGK